MDFLSEIIAVKRQRVAAAKARMTFKEIRELGQARAATNSLNLADALRSNRGINLIAEFKRRSPSKGKINSQADPVTTAQLYESAGAAAVSVLTEEDYFAGSLEDLRLIRERSFSLPILRKDFIFDEYQVYESAWAGANALLLIVAALDDETLRKLRAITEDELGLTALVEVHTSSELDRAVNCGARVIGVNNRDLRTFNVSIDTSLQLAKLAPRDAILISESGLTPATVRQLREAGYRGFLVGEALMRASDPAAAVREFLEEPEGHQQSRSIRVKICGITSIDDARAALSAGADMLGFNFYRPSPRYIEPQAAAEIINAIRSKVSGNDRPASMVGVFVDEAIENVSRIAHEAGLDGTQLHGEETAEYCRRLKELCPQKFIIKAVAAKANAGLESAGLYPADAIMIDAFDEKLRGGTGRVADWSIAREVARAVPRLFLAGGLSPENVAAAIAAVGPYAVDVCSAVEAAPGRKSAKRMRQFVDAVRSSKLEDETAAAGEGS
jgi:indole-3-glycerol phosphate synthase/phosphoribosylanthranilate isomerase/anthranilate synthase/indole-3-glycerol phosphate synthase/phosphoribosylanthranilate isomerase